MSLPLPSKPVAVWCAALRSGQYRQTQSQLRSDALSDQTGYCCLGVACEIDPSLDWYTYEDVIHDDEFDLSKRVLASAGSPPAETQRLFDLEPGDVDILITFNDEDAYTFDMIADVLAEWHTTSAGLHPPVITC